MKLFLIFRYSHEDREHSGSTYSPGIFFLDYYELLLGVTSKVACKLYESLKHFYRYLTQTEVYLVSRKKHIIHVSYYKPYQFEYSLSTTLREALSWTFWGLRILLVLINSATSHCATFSTVHSTALETFAVVLSTLIV